MLPRVVLRVRGAAMERQVVIDAGTRLDVVVGRPLAGNRDDGKVSCLRGVWGAKRMHVGARRGA
ncbi:hypothetical protein SCWH03_47490 [Streptomyces pacificus]|uniref:Uncharacterized protein n=1 Tax=Streptomyces pacificus TaxID=2705029 RepID=A0A6A0B3X3_9ACTN|nr:hypothetical protein SCWH03_47490 [Streptomyces pacificus]